MKKIMTALAILAVPALSACDKGPELSGYDTIKEVIQANYDSGAGNPTLATGEKGDFVIKLKATKGIKRLAKQEKNAMFLSVNQDQFTGLIERGYCLVNVLPQKVLNASGMQDSTCYYRLFCGTEKDLQTGDYYAIEVCK